MFLSNPIHPLGSEIYAETGRKVLRARGVGWFHGKIIFQTQQYWHTYELTETMEAYRNPVEVQTRLYSRIEKENQTQSSKPIQMQFGITTCWERESYFSTMEWHCLSIDSKADSQDQESPWLSMCSFLSFLFDIFSSSTVGHRL